MEYNGIQWNVIQWNVIQCISIDTMYYNNVVIVTLFNNPECSYISRVPLFSDWREFREVSPI